MQLKTQTRDSFNVTEAIIAPNEFLADILIPHKIDFLTIDKIAREGRDTCACSRC